MSLGRSFKEGWLYTTEFVRHPRATSALAPTGWRIIKKLATFTPKGTKRVLEMGPGSGRLLETLLQEDRIAADGRLGAIDTNERFLHLINDQIRDPRLTTVLGDARQLVEHRDHIFGKGEKVDRVYASLPFTIMEDSRHGIFEAVHDILTDDGEFIVYIFNDIRHHLEDVFEHVQSKPEYGLVWPPFMQYIVHRARKQKTAPVNGRRYNGLATRNGRQH